jgi:UDP-glucose 4-epimerase
LCGVKTFIYSSTMGVYGKDLKYLPVDEKHPANASNPYGLSKRMGEELVEFYSKQYGLNAIILRYSGVFGLGKKQGAVVNFIQNAALNKPLKITENISWDIVYVGDIIKASIKALEIADKMKFEIINIGSGMEISAKALAEKIIKLTGSKSKIIMPNKNLPCYHFCFNINKAKRLLKFKPILHDTSLKANIAEVKLNSRKTEGCF